MRPHPRVRHALLRGFAACCVAAGGILGATSLASVPACQKDPPKPSAANPIVIGVSLGLTKDLASFSQPLRDTVHAAEGEINAGGGILGRQVQFDIVDDQSDEADVVTGVAQAFADKNVAAMIGPVGSGQVKTVQGIFYAKQIIEISPSATSTELTTLQPSGDRYFFRTTPADDFQGAAVILFATKTPRGLGDAGVAPIALADSGVDEDSGAAPVTGDIAPTCSKLALVYIDNPYGTAMAQVISDNFPKREPVGTRTVVSQLKIPLDAKASYADVVGPIIQAAPECLAIISYENAAAQLIRDFKADPGYADLAKNGFFFIGTDGIYTPGFITQSLSNAADPTSDSVAEGVFGTNPDTQPGTAEYNAFRTIYSSYFPLKSADDAPPFAANTFDAAVLAAFAIQKAGSATDRVGIRDSLRTVATAPGRTITPASITDGLTELRNGGDIDYKGASGNCDFQPNGNVNSGFIVWQAVRDTTSKKIVFKTVARFATEDLVGEIQ